MDIFWGFQMMFGWLCSLACFCMLTAVIAQGTEHFANKFCSPVVSPEACLERTALRCNKPQPLINEETVNGNQLFGTLKQLTNTNKLGKGFYLPGVTIDDPEGSGGNVFKMFDTSCISVDTNNSKIVGARSYYTTTDILYDEFEEFLGLDVGLQGMFTLGFTIRDKSLIDKGTRVMGTSISSYNRVRIETLDMGCIGNRPTSLSRNLIEDLEALQVNINRPEELKSWELYDDILTKYGSHIVTQINYGTSMKQWAFARQEDEYTMNQLDIRSCAKLWGLIEPCVGVTKDQTKMANGLQMCSWSEFRGGKAETLKKLKDPRSNITYQTIDAFLAEADDYTAPINYFYKPIWTVLRERYINDSKHHAIAVNLEKYYKGFLDFGCCPIRSDDGKLLRKFQHSPSWTESNPDYECRLEREGCQNDSDCHIGNGAESGVYCYGATCVEHYYPYFGFKAKGARLKTKQNTKQNNPDEGIHQSCLYSDDDKRPKCDKTWVSENHALIWPINEVTGLYPKLKDCTKKDEINGTSEIKVAKFWCLLFLAATFRM